jgi:hypothetical protein
VNGNVISICNVLFEKNYMLSTLVILKLMYECSSLSDSGSEAMNFVTTICIKLYKIALVSTQKG